MIVCVCNNLTEIDVDKAKDHGCKRIKEFYGYLGIKPNCGICCRHIIKTIRS